MGAYEYIAAIFALDFAFIIDVIMSNLLWIFLFYAAGYFFSSGKKPLVRGIVLFMLVATSLDIFQLTHVNFVYTAGGLSLLYFIRMPVLIFIEKTEGLSQYFTLAWLSTWFLVITILAFGM